jgi:hypothetical protein
VSKRDIGNTARIVTKVTWTNGQGSSRLSLGGKAVLGEGCRASCDLRGTLVFFGKNNKERPHWAALTHPDFLAPVAISVVIIFVVLAFVVLVAIAIPHLVAVPVVLVAISVSIAGLSVSPAPAIICVVVIPIVSYGALIITEARVISEACFILPPPLPIFALALTAQPVVLDIVISTFSTPLSVIRIVVSIVAAGAVIRVVSSISVLRASGSHDCPQSQS